VSANLAALFGIWGGRITYWEAFARRSVTVTVVPSLARAFPHWFGWSGATRDDARMSLIR
jgi:hypothetical protein